MRHEHMAYLQWLIESFVEDPAFVGFRDPYEILYRQMHRKAYYFIVDYDENRAADGVYLRDMYLDLFDRGEVPQGPCSFLEFLIGVSMRLSGMLADGEPLPVSQYFWELLNRLGLNEFTDELYREDATQFQVDAIMVDFMDRRYDRCGKGGLFPLTPPCRDQRKVEVWYQMNSYLLQNPDFF
jgi:hypothetical protein